MCNNRRQRNFVRVPIQTNQVHHRLLQRSIDRHSLFFPCRRSDFDLKMISQYDTPDTSNTQDLFDIGTDFSDALDNTQSQTSVSIQPTVPSSASPILNQQSVNLYQQQQPPSQQLQQQQLPPQPRLTYIAPTRGQSTAYTTAGLQRIQTMTPTSTIVRPTNGIQQQPTIYTQQQQLISSAGGLNRPLYHRMPTVTQQTSMPSTLIRQPYNTTGMINMNQSVPQMSIVKVTATRFARQQNVASARSPLGK